MKLQNKALTEIIITKYSICVNIYLPERPSASVVVTKHRCISNVVWENVRINWPNIGASTLQETNVFLQALKEAQKIAVLVEDLDINGLQNLGAKEFVDIRSKKKS